MKKRNRFLSRILRMLVDEWGYEQVEADLARIKGPIDISDEFSTHRPDRSPKRKVNLSPSEQVQKALVDPSRKQLLLQIARRYEQKQFLPSVAAVTEFLTMMGNDPGDIKDRIQAFRVLLRALLQLPTDRLNHLTNSSLHSGPSELGPISEAIAAAGDHLPRHSQEYGQTKEFMYEEVTFPETK